MRKRKAPTYVRLMVYSHCKGSDEKLNFMDIIVFKVKCCTALAVFLFYILFFFPFVSNIVKFSASLNANKCNATFEVM